MNQETHSSSQVYIQALSNYSVCIKPFLRVAQERYVTSHLNIES